METLLWIVLGFVLLYGLLYGALNALVQGDERRIRRRLRRDWEAYQASLKTRQWAAGGRWDESR